MRLFSNIRTKRILIKERNTVRQGKHSVIIGNFFMRFLLILFLVYSADIAKSTELKDSPGALREIVPTDVFYEIQELSMHIELVRQYMGAPKANILDIRIHNAAPHDVYFQALTLFRKANRLLFEITRLQEEPPPLPEKFILPVNVMELVRKSHQSIEKVMVDMNIDQDHMQPLPVVSKTPTDVFKEIQMVNRQLNQLLERPFSPADVYQVVTLAIGYAARHLSRYSGAIRIPGNPPL